MKQRPIPYGKQHITDQDINAVVNVLRSDYLTQGPQIELFEDSFKAKIGAKFAVAVANGTAALHLSAMALGIQKGQKVITTPITFSASANCVKYCGGDIHFVDIDPVSYNIDLSKVGEAFSQDKNIKGVIPVNFAGYPVNLEVLKIIADRYKAWILEDACHSPGGYFLSSTGDKLYCGSCDYSDIAIFSFHPVKHIACGEGGMITTNNPDIYKRLMSLRTHGIVKKPEQTPWYYELEELGFNYRLSDIHAALGNSQLERLDENIASRQNIANRYYEELKNVGDIVLPKVEANVHHAFHLFVILTSKRDQLYSFLREKGIFTQIHYIPLHYMPYYQQFGWKKGDFPVAEDYYERCISLPIFYGLGEDEQGFVIDSIKDFYKKYES